eukprot:TRINITY_DN17107_c0_g1_i2.p1 TRINITY_DN17107_c0_g1~~TRINITY_DN17107_c0_g1_i2.p1  ORF type:complete len:448 (+),score=38.54 TRINITY_DN17107_c0_g1_i2:783-2126(+)
MKVFVPLSNRDILKRVLIVYGWSLLVVAVVALQKLPIHAHPEFGLACIPLEEDYPSEILFWVAFTPALLFVPVITIVIIACQTYSSFPQDFCRTGTTFESRQLLQVCKVFGRLFIALMCLWTPAAMLMWVFPLSGLYAFIGGSISHLQGLVSAYLYSLKDDIQDEIFTSQKCLCQKFPRLANMLRGRQEESESSLSTPINQVDRGVNMMIVWQVQAQLRCDASTSDCVSEFVKPATSHLKCSYASLMAASDDAGGVGRSSVFVSHSWLYQYATLVDILAHQAALATTQHFYFIDIFAINQHEAMTEGELGKLGEKIISCGTLLLASSPLWSPLPLARVWCLYELYVATVNNVPIEMFVTKEDMGVFFEAIDANSGGVELALSGIDAREACATIPADRDYLFQLIDEGVGFKRFNDTIASTMRRSFKKFALQRTLACVAPSPVVGDSP